MKMRRLRARGNLTRIGCYHNERAYPQMRLRPRTSAICPNDPSLVEIPQLRKWNGSARRTCIIARSALITSEARSVYIRAASNKIKRGSSPHKLLLAGRKFFTTRGDEEYVSTFFYTVKTVDLTSRIIARRKL